MSDLHFTDVSPSTLAIEDRDYPEWHRGRDRYAVWLIDADTAPLRQRLERARSHLHPWLSPHCRTPHVTLFVCGFPANVARWDDDIDGEQQRCQRRALENLALPRFTLRIGGLSSFDSAAFLQVDDPGASLAALRAALAGPRREIRDTPYVPHLTVGLYRGAFDKRQVAHRLAAFDDSTPIELSVQNIHFATYAARELGGPLRFVETVILR